MEPADSSSTFEDEHACGEEEAEHGATLPPPSVSSSHRHDDNNGHIRKLGLWQGVALLTADCLGVGILALPEAIHVLGWTFGLTFLILQLPINYYAGSLLAWTAVQVEREYEDQHSQEGKEDDENESGLELVEGASENNTSGASNSESDAAHTDADTGADTDTDTGMGHHPDIPSLGNKLSGEEKDGLVREDPLQVSQPKTSLEKDRLHPPTEDLVGIAKAVFDEHRLGEESTTLKHPHPGGKRRKNTTARNLVLLLYYLNLFLILGDYILVMSHAVAATWGDKLCITTAGLIASTLMFAICQLNTMALLGQYVSMASLAAMIVVLGQCIWASHHNPSPHSLQQTGLHGDKNSGAVRLLHENSNAWRRLDEIVNGSGRNGDDQPLLLQKFSALASICFAVGSQKLFLNIRYELKHREKDAAPALARSLTLFGAVYVAVILFSGSDPPSFLFDAIPKGTWNRTIAGFLLWGHVAVSYAINSQALCSSLERLVFQDSDHKSRIRWLLLTLALAVSSYLVANGIPFFKDLVALIGAATTVPLTLALPPVLYHHWQQWTRLDFLRKRRLHIQSPEHVGVLQLKRTRNCDCVTSSALLLYAIVFLGVGLAGSLASIKQDWSLSGQRPFACHQH